MVYLITYNNGEPLSSFIPSRIWPLVTRTMKPALSKRSLFWAELFGNCVFGIQVGWPKLTWWKSDNFPDANNHRSSTTTNQNLCLKSQSSKLNYRLWNQKLHHYNISLFIFLSNPWCKQKPVSNHSSDFRYPQAHRFISRATKSKSAARAELFSLSLVGFLLGFRHLYFLRNPF